MVFVARGGKISSDPPLRAAIISVTQISGRGPGGTLCYKLQGEWNAVGWNFYPLAKFFLSWLRSRHSKHTTETQACLPVRGHRPCNEITPFVIARVITPIQFLFLTVARQYRNQLTCNRRFEGFIFVALALSPWGIIPTLISTASRASHASPTPLPNCLY